MDIWVISHFWEGMILGFSIAMPVGPIAILCIRNSLSYGMRGGFASGLGAAVADLFYGGIAILALETVLHFIDCHLTLIRILGALILCILGFSICRTKPFTGSLQVERKGVATLFFTTCALTLTNPMTLFAFLAIYATLGISCAGLFPDAFLLMAGLFTGSALWWLLLSFVASNFRDKIDQGALVWIHQASGFLILAFGLFALLYSVSG